MSDAGIVFDLDKPKLVMTLDGVPDDVEELTLLRQDKSHRGLSKFKRLRHLWAGRVNQEMIEEIAALPELEILRIKNMSAVSLEPLGKNRKLKRLIVHGGNKVPDMEWTHTLTPTLEVLFLDSFFRANDIRPLGQLTGLKTLGLEGGMDRKFELESLEPLGALSNLQYLFLASTRVADKSLTPLQKLKKLRHLSCGAYFPDAEFVALRKALPDLDCSWFKMIEEHGSIRNGMAAFTKRMRRA
jgi:Leucine-rich repeat (LRR) protein